MPVERPGRNAGLEPRLEQRLLYLHHVLEEARVPHAFGGAIALGYYREPRATADIDLNVFLDESGHEQVLDLMSDLFGVPERGRALAALAQDNQVRLDWDGVPVDLFFSNTDFHESMEKRRASVPFLDEEIPILSVEDLVVCKVLFDRHKDWADVHEVYLTRGATLDAAYIRSWLLYFLDVDDHRFGQLDRTASSATEEQERWQS